MLRWILALVAAFGLFIGAAMAAEGTIVSMERGKWTVKVGDKEQTIDIMGVKFFDADGKEVNRRMARELFKKDTKVEIVEKDGKVVEIKLKK